MPKRRYVKNLYTAYLLQPHSQGLSSYRPLELSSVDPTRDPGNEVVNVWFLKGGRSLIQFLCLRNDNSDGVTYDTSILDLPQVDLMGFRVYSAIQLGYRGWDLTHEEN